MSGAENNEPTSAVSRVPSHGRGKLRDWPKGVSGNPGGLGGLYADTLHLARVNSPDAMRTLVDRLKSTDDRVAIVAAQAILERAWGKPKDFDPRAAGDGRVVLDLKNLPRDLLLAILQATQMGAVKPAEPEGEVVVVQEVSDGGG